MRQRNCWGHRQAIDGTPVVPPSCHDGLAAESARFVRGDRAKSVPKRSPSPSSAAARMDRPHPGYTSARTRNRPMTSSHTDATPISELFAAHAGGDAGASDRLFSMLYEELKNKARILLRVGHAQTLSTTELVNETYVRLHGNALPLESRAHFFNLAARAMRQVLIDRARRRLADKRGDGVVSEPLSIAVEIEAELPFDVLALDQAMSDLAAIDTELAELAQLHLFGGMSMADIAELRGIGERSAYRLWRSARMFLIRTLGED